MLTLNLTSIFRARGIEKPFSFLVKAGFTHHSANIIINSNTNVLKLDHIETLCIALNCEPNDLFLFTPNKGKLYPENNPLFNLRQDDSSLPLQETLNNMPYKELKEVAKTIANQKKG